jgi:hypothetical protein
MKLEYSHQLNQAEAIQKLAPFLDNLKAQYGDKVKVVQEEWKGNVLHFRIKVKTGIPFIEPEIPGTITVEDTLLWAEAPVPAFAQSMAEEAQGKFTQILNTCFQKS